MTEPKPLPQTELDSIARYYSDRQLVLDEQRDFGGLFECAATDIDGLLATIRERDATIRRRGELIAWLVSGDAVVVRGDGGICIHTKSAAEIGREYATEVHAIVAGLEPESKGGDVQLRFQCPECGEGPLHHLTTCSRSGNS